MGSAIPVARCPMGSSDSSSSREDDEAPLNVGDRVRLAIRDDDMNGKTGIFRGNFILFGTVRSHIELDESHAAFPADPKTVKKII